MRTQTKAERTGFVEANGTQLYCEVQGQGPSVLFISGATGDAGHYERVADLLSDEFTVVTYDRRGNSRSPRPAGWTTTSMDEQADDAVGLLRSLGLAPAAVFGSSGGAVILLNLLVRHPDVLRGAIIHEPPLMRVLADPQATMAELGAMAEKEMAAGGPRRAMETFLRVNAGDKNFENLAPALRERMLGNAELFFGAEIEAFGSFLPDADRLAAVGIPVQVLASSDNRGIYYYEAAEWVASHLATALHEIPGGHALGPRLQEIPGGHAAYMDRAREVVTVIRPFLRQVSQMS